MTKTLSLAVYVNGQYQPPQLFDWNVNIHKGKSDAWSITSPSTMTLTMWVWDANGQTYNYQLNDVISLDVTINGSTYTAFTGTISDISASIRNYSTTAYIYEISISAIGFLNSLVNTTWQNPVATAPVSTYIGEMAGQLDQQTWASVSDTLQWGQMWPYTTWADFNGVQFEILYYGSSYDPTLAIATGTRPMWQDLTDIATSTGANFREATDGNIYFEVTPQYPSITATVQAGDLLAELSSHASTVDIRNVAVVSNNAGATRTRSDQASVSQYGQQVTDLQTIQTSTAECATLGDRIINGLSKTYSTPDHFTVDMMSDTGTVGLDFLEVNAGAQVTLNGIPPYFSDGSGTAIVAVNEVDINIGKQTLTVSCSCQDWNVYSASVSWEQIDASFTWASYGVAYPTQTWSDL